MIATFNGRGFDVPFIYLRSALLNVPISRKEWLGYRYQTEPHCDLAEQLTFYGVSGRDGAARRFNLDFYCKAFGIRSPHSRDQRSQVVLLYAKESLRFLLHSKANQPLARKTRSSREIHLIPERRSLQR